MFVAINCIILIDGLNRSIILMLREYLLKRLISSLMLIRHSLILNYHYLLSIEIEY